MVQKIVGLQELETYWSLTDLVNAHAALDEYAEMTKPKVKADGN